MARRRNADGLLQHDALAPPAAVAVAIRRPGRHYSRFLGFLDGADVSRADVRRDYPALVHAHAARLRFRFNPSRRDTLPQGTSPAAGQSPADPRSAGLRSGMAAEGSIAESPDICFHGHSSGARSVGTLLDACRGPLLESSGSSRQPDGRLAFLNWFWPARPRPRRGRGWTVSNTHRFAARSATSATCDARPPPLVERRRARLARAAIARRGVRAARSRSHARRPCPSSRWIAGRCRKWSAAPDRSSIRKNAEDSAAAKCEKILHGR